MFRRPETPRGTYLAIIAHLERDFPELRGFPKTGPLDEGRFVGLGVAKFEVGERHRAKTLFNHYLDSYVGNETNSVDDGSEAAAIRREAMAVATYYLVRFEFGRANYPGVIKLGKEYHLRFPLQPERSRWETAKIGWRSTSWLMELVGSAMVRAGRLEEAAAYLEVAEATFPDHRPGWEFYLELDRAREELREGER